MAGVINGNGKDIGPPGPHIITFLVEDRPGVFAKVTGLIRRRNFNISSIAVGPTYIKKVTRMTFLINADEATLEQVVKQLNKMIEVLRVTELKPQDSVMRELALIKINTTDQQERNEALQFSNIFRGNVLDVSPTSLTVEITGDSEKIDAFLELTNRFGIIEVARTGITALSRGSDPRPRGVDQLALLDYE
jgi:acetolactate synthase-1/3 small subunit